MVVRTLLRVVAVGTQTSDGCENTETAYGSENTLKGGGCENTDRWWL